MTSALTSVAEELKKGRQTKQIIQGTYTYEIHNIHLSINLTLKLGKK